MHTSFKKNVSVYVKMKDGSSFVAKWHERVRKWFRFTNRESVRISKVRFISFNKARSTVIDTGKLERAPAIKA